MDIGHVLTRVNVLKLNMCVMENLDINIGSAANLLISALMSLMRHGRFAATLHVLVIDGNVKSTGNAKSNKLRLELQVELLCLSEEEQPLRGFSSRPKTFIVWWPDSVGGLDFEYACPACQLKGDNFFVWGRT